MKVYSTVKLDMSKEEVNALQKVYNMLFNLVEEDEKRINEELPYSDVEAMLENLSTLWELSGHDTDLL